MSNYLEASGLYTKTSYELVEDVSIREVAKDNLIYMDDCSSDSSNTDTDTELAQVTDPINTEEN